MTDHILNNISKVLRGDFSSFDAEPERIRIPQEAAGVINERVAKRIGMCMREGCISLAVSTVESSGIMGIHAASGPKRVFSA